MRCSIKLLLKYLNASAGDRISTITACRSTSTLLALQVKRYENSDILSNSFQLNKNRVLLLL